ncbi:MAG TPA: cbb3-type cytochrome c oxidase subunit 3 [Steroidobacteraceae bacterium]|nr:cbb3-type cytochrome c oxidase subunit 3 [Steroidobacteraceae bacterium]
MTHEVASQLGLFRGLLTAVLFCAFLVLWVWAWRKARKQDFDSAARLPLQDDDGSIPHGDRS